VFYAVALEHFLLIFKALLDSMFVDVPEDVELTYEIKVHQKSLVEEEMDTLNPEEEVAFYTSDAEDGRMQYVSQSK
jgi:hypothetical protein